MAAKVFTNIHCCKTDWCGYKRIPQDKKKELFDEFYKLDDCNIQNAYLFGLIKTVPCKRQYRKDRINADETRRHNSSEYYIKSKENIDIRVCKIAILSVHGISKQRLDYSKVVPQNIYDDTSSLWSPKLDRRGKHHNSPHACKEQDVELVKKHIRLFSRYKSHYSLSQNPNRQYILSASSVEEMHWLYIIYCNENETVPLKLHKYRYIFNNDFNIGFKLPRSGTCKICDKAVNVPLEDTPLSHRIHLQKAQMAYRRLSEAKKMALVDTCDTLVISMDLEQALPTPMLSTEVVFYLRQLWTCNFGIHICNTNGAFMCVWPESNAGRGADEIGSCLLQVIPKIKGNMKKLIAYSDSCVGQNKNFPIMCVWIYMIEMGWFESIEHRFLVPGHIYLPCDADFGIIEKLKR
ncbi:hypothetical protein ANN_09769 [Periplaneta americana]|uniref:DUF7869 domain-containing protein n=1 Tax=Periplaneta americana TaxID=6978 RepID=A0ABQ8TM76_PERAM|nr:hypothetical protein ANN_09769 [Periplaneta americana]